MLPREAAIAAIKRAAQKSYGVKGEAVVAANYAAIDAALDGLREVPIGEISSIETPDVDAGADGHGDVARIRHGRSPCR